MGRLSKGLNLSEKSGAVKFIKRLNEQFKQLAKYETEHKTVIGKLFDVLNITLKGKIKVGEKFDKSGNKYPVIANTKENQAKVKEIEKALIQSGYKTAKERREEIRKQAKEIKEKTKSKRKITDIIRELKERQRLFEFITNEGEYAYQENGEMYGDIAELTNKSNFTELSTDDLKKLEKMIRSHKKELFKTTVKTIKRDTGKDILEREFKK